MTEPPEPRRPEEDGGEEDYEAAWENADADEILDGLEDDALLDSIAKGVRGDLGPDELTELLSGLRDVPDSADIPMKNTARVERGENVMPPRTPQEGSPQRMISESIAALQAVSGSTAAAGPLNEARSSLETTVSMLTQAVQQVVELNGAATQALEGNENGRAEVQGAGEHAAGAIEDAIELVQQAVAGVAQAIEHEAAFRNTASEVANRLAGS